MTSSPHDFEQVILDIKNYITMTKDIHFTLMTWSYFLNDMIDVGLD